METDLTLRTTNMDTIDVITTCLALVKEPRVYYFYYSERMLMTFVLDVWFQVQATGMQAKATVLTSVGEYSMIKTEATAITRRIIEGISI